MNIQSTFEKDIRHKKLASGAYEWWYFDAKSADETTELVIIFYEGNPFSRRYIKQQEDKALAEDFPAISISVYQHGKPVYYSFTEVKKEEARFSDEQPEVQIGAHKMIGEREGDAICYTLNLEEVLPSGDCIEGQLTFESRILPENLFAFSGGKVNHEWNVCQPRARVFGHIQCSSMHKKEHQIDFEGQGYHDHNIGFEPLKQQFYDWYWGRFHFKDATLIYYVMDEEQPINGWLVDAGEGKILQTFDEAKKADESRTLFGLRSAKKLVLFNSEAEVMIQQTDLLDNGPFYQRFGSDAFLNIGNGKVIDSSRGITEYLCPPRIYKRLFWPLTNMRIRYKKESPHWVQRSKRLYRWTW